ncbi:SLC41 divalent cation transporters, integral membrane domain-containing protein [Strongyloides ratti]|uniref:SLC41 divalent cation transporters, integral membrane domain-containing protein n=1 Tax=Strongyloides ratti TaxID=34506 RepID=A0A090KYA0_STRRB|nr:SLC41 divalent cation transporters, integral membrane domain-containing protein [Strongyloides ratti]CEF60847.1 SLC41 divalent cation transporters, integral membrane domain-containing protein [Strongyloides ratti]
MNNLSNCEKEENSNKRINLDRMVKKIVDNENTRNDFEKTEINSCKKGLYENLEKTNSNDDVTIENESLLKFTITCFFTIAAAGIGMAVAGRFLELGQESYLFTSYPSLIAIFPPLVGMKGNIEMTLASRLGTLVNKNMLNLNLEAFKHVIPNISVVSIQSVLLSTLSTFVVNLICLNTIIFENMEIVYAISIGTALIASTVLSLIVVIGIFIAKYLNYDPDNIVGPIAACLGDAVTIVIMMYYGSLIDNLSQKYSWIPLVCLLIIYIWSIIMIPIAWQYSRTRTVLKSGWFATTIAMLLSSISGMFLHSSTQMASYAAAFQPILNGLSGNVGAIQAAKISTQLEIKYPDHVFEKEYNIYSYFIPFRLFLVKDRESYQAIILLIISIVCQCFLVPIAHSLMGFQNNVSFLFNILYILASIFLVLTLLYISQWICRYLWMYGYSADDNSIPIITAFGDLLGSILIFSILYIIYNIELPIIEGDS